LQFRLVIVRFSKNQPLTFAAPFDSSAPAASAMSWDVRSGAPQIFLEADTGPATVGVRNRDLLNSGPTAPEFVVEIDTDGAHIFGSATICWASRPEAGTQFSATYASATASRET